MKRLCLLFPLLACCGFALELPTFFNDNMILQRDKPVPIWGRAPVGQTVTVEFAGQKISAQTDQEGNWRAFLAAMPAEKNGRDLIIRSDTTVTIKNVVVGDIWLCAGQSNMDYGLGGIEGAKDIIAASQNANIRLMHVPYLWSRFPQDDFRKLAPPTILQFKKLLAKSTDQAIRDFYAKTFGNAADYNCNAFNGANTLQALELVGKSNSPETAKAYRELLQFSISEDFGTQNAGPINELKPILANYPDEAIRKIYENASQRKVAGWESFLNAKELKLVQESLNKTTVPSVAEPYQKLQKRWLANKLKGFHGIKPSWHVCAPNNVGGFAAVGYLAGRDLQKELDIPIGLIKIAWGGCRIESMCTLESIKAVPGLQGEVSRNEALVADMQSKDTDGNWTKSDNQLWLERNRHQRIHVALYNGMVRPLSPMAVKGMIWYQGEDNHYEGAIYGEKLRALALTWRTAFNAPDMPIYVVLIPPFKYDMCFPERLPNFICAQQHFAETDSNAGFIVTTDSGNPDDIHPREKRPLSARLAKLMLYKTYGLGDDSALAPTFKNVTFNGSQAIVAFNHPNGLKTTDGKMPSFVMLAGKDGKFVPADSTAIVNDTLVAVAQAVPEPVAISFGWSNIAAPNLVNRAGHPVMPFKSQN